MIKEKALQKDIERKEKKLHKDDLDFTNGWFKVGS